MKFKTKRRTKTALFSVFLICLFLGGFTSQALTSLEIPTYPATAEIGKAFEIMVNIYYQDEQDCLYGDYIVFNYGIGDGSGYINPYANRINVDITNLTDYPRPTEIVVEIDLSAIVCEVGETFRFVVKILRGAIYHSDYVQYMGLASSNLHDITIVEAKRASFYTLGMVFPLLLLSVVVLVRKKKLKKEVK